MNETKPERPFDAQRIAANGMMWLCQIMGVTLELFLHNRVGERYVGMKSAFAVALLVLFSMLFPTDNVLPLYGFLAAFVAMCVVTRIEILRRRWRNDNTIHSRYSGRSRFQSLFPRLSELNLKRIEALAVMAFGFILQFVNRPLGMYLLLAGFATFVEIFLSEECKRMRFLDLVDAGIEQEQMAEKFRQARQS